MPEHEQGLGSWERHLSEPFRGRKIICAYSILAAMQRQVEELNRWGAQRPLLLPNGVGIGPTPTTADADIVMFETPVPPRMTDEVTARMHGLDNMPARMKAAVDAYDPDGAAAWLLSPVSPNDPLLGRPVYGGRPRHQAALEDKLIVDHLLRAIGAPRAESVNVEASYDALLRASDDIMTRSGASSVVWSGDTRDGVNGGGDLVRWVTSEALARGAAGFFAGECDRVRVMPFLEGVPCSIHGMVMADGTLPLRPMEQANLRSRETGRFLYGGMGTTWDPPTADRNVMRDTARMLGEYLREEHNYKGGFSIDGVVTTDGFRPTEINPRFSGGLTRLSRVARPLCLDLVQINLLLGRDVRMPVGQYEELALAALDSERFSESMGMSPGVASDEPQSVDVVERGGRFELAPANAVAAAEAMSVARAADVGASGPADPGADGSGRSAQTDRSDPGETVRQPTVDVIVGTISRGPTGFFRFSPSPDVAPVLGARAADTTVKLFEFADRVWGAALAPFEVAPDVRP